MKSFLSRLLFIIFPIVGISTAFFVVSPAISAEIHTFTGKVVGVADGDTMTVLHDKRPVKVRLAGIDCPEKKQPFGTKAKQFTSSLAFGKVVKVKEAGKDRYHRVVGIVVLPDGRNLNHELVRNGLAWQYVKYSKDSTLGDLESSARQDHIGLWADKNPIPPWIWRARKTKRDSAMMN